MPVKVNIIGAGISGLSAGIYLANAGYQVRIFEKNEGPGGRAGQLKAGGYTFDTGPSWYWMPDIFEHFFQHLGTQSSDYYRLVRLDPAYRVFFGKMDFIDIPAGEQELYHLFDSLEENGGLKLKKFLAEARTKYQIGINDFARRPGLSVFEFMDRDFIRGIVKLDMFQSVTRSIRKYFKHPRLIQILQFPVIFLGSAPDSTPALYTLMNYADLMLGTWYPMGGMYRIIEAMADVAASLGVEMNFNSPVEKLIMDNNCANEMLVNGKRYHSDVVIGSADYQHVEQQLLPEAFRVYGKKYWEKRIMAPSAILIFLGIRKRLQHVLHHNLFFDEDFDQHVREIYKHPKWPEKPSLYISCTSKTDPSVAPEGHENVVVLIPVAPGLEDTDELREQYFNLAVDRIERITNQAIKSHISCKHIFSQRDFIREYNSFKGNAYGLANTLFQTAIFKPAIKSKKVHNLYYTGQLTVPGPGVPPALLSGEIVSNEIRSNFPIIP